MNYIEMFIPLAIVMLIFSFFVPWISINFIDKSLYNPLDIITGLINTDGNLNLSGVSIELLEVMNSYGDSYYSLIFSMVFFVFSFVVLILTFVFKEHRSKLFLFLGILAILSGMLWIYSIESFKIHFVEDSQASGGIIGEEFRGKERIIINSIFKMGVGYKFVIAAGVLAILGYLWPVSNVNKFNKN